MLPMMEQHTVSTFMQMRRKCQAQASHRLLRHECAFKKFTKEETGNGFQLSNYNFLNVCMTFRNYCFKRPQTELNSSQNDLQTSMTAPY